MLCRWQLLFVRCLSGTPAEAGVREDDFNLPVLILRVSVEPPPKQGCESVNVPVWMNTWSLSGTPAEAGVRGDPHVVVGLCFSSQWNPRRSRGARVPVSALKGYRSCLSGTPAEAGVRADLDEYMERYYPSLSGTPAEAGVRDQAAWKAGIALFVSVEPPPK